MKPLFDAVSVGVVELTAPTREGSQRAVAIDEKHRAAKIAFLGQSVQKCSGWISASTTTDCDITDSL
ncbi:hypothetical protein C484_01390 [Natrialba taiwanensis DSM 12281]|uniref:Uncharacterized protein n=1 Tax=Natrialba taiwanensis DSM 12281 TaxID=1230458 RepID=M0AD55_9EURY|nr:hypothetical protein C484_01390 [Natrialba taiwanensis DSM 12281]